jgi:diaminohydroxyphosphoribosylaminopyrimidine deaminase/5-amino-6-(5-phosphoribosylamino)uracil reductase
MRRCFDLARLGGGKVSPNPMVEAVLVGQDRILGEGYHRQYGEAHAEVQAVAAVPPSLRPLIPRSIFYISLEPCCVYGRTPPCTQMILREGIPRVVISTLDTSPEVNGKSVALLREQGVEVISGILEREGRELFAPRDRFARLQRPYITLKFARTEEGFLAPLPLARQPISSAAAQRLVHRWRGEHDSILIGYRTALTDDPLLTNRFFPGGRSPLRIVLDPELQLPAKLRVFQADDVPTWIVYESATAKPPEEKRPGLVYFRSAPGMQGVLDLLGELRNQKVSSLLVEGGAAVIRRFLEADLWDEARVLVGSAHFARGLPAPAIPSHPAAEYAFGADRILRYRHPAFER